MRVTWKSLLAASLRAHATPANPPPTTTTRVWAPLRGHPRSEKRGAAASRPASAGGADSSRSVEPLRELAVGRVGDLMDRPLQVVLEADLVVPRQDVDPGRAQCVLDDRADDLFDPFRERRPRAGLRLTSDASPAEIRTAVTDDLVITVGIEPPRSPGPPHPSRRATGRGRESCHGGGRSSCRTASKGMCRARMIRPSARFGTPAGVNVRFQAPPAISRLRRATNASSASRTGGSSGGGTASARSRFQIALARWVAVCAPSACHVSKLRQSDTSGR